MKNITSQTGASVSDDQLPSKPEAKLEAAICAHIFTARKLCALCGEKQQ